MQSSGSLNRMLQKKVISKSLVLPNTYGLGVVLRNISNEYYLFPNKVNPLNDDVFALE